MKYLLSILVFLFYATISFAQSFEVNIEAVANKKIRDVNGTVVLLPDDEFIINNYGK